MSRKNIVIAGAGFAGISALRRLRRYRNVLKGQGYDIILVDEKDDYEFIPMLPDVIGGWLKPDRIRYPIQKLASRYGCRYVKARVEGLDPGMKAVTLNDYVINYEYLIVSSGSCTNFFNNPSLQTACRKLDNVGDALKIKDELLQRARHASPSGGEVRGEVRVVIVGGGYTGIEIATSILWLFRSFKTTRCRIILLEKAPDILTVVPEWMRQETRRELEDLGVEIVCGDSLKSYDGKTIHCESGQLIEADLCLWTAGVKVSPFLDTFKADKERTRIKVEKTLLSKDPKYDNIFFTGDAASFVDEKTGQVIRMAVMFSMGQGKIAAENVVLSILKKPLLEYKVHDLGYLILMAQGKAPGIVLNRRVHGGFGYLLHYWMCFYRSEWKNKGGIVKDLILKGAGISGQRSEKK